MSSRFFRRPVCSYTAVGVGAAILFETIYGASFVFTKSLTGSYSTFTIQFWRFSLALFGFLILSAPRLVRHRLSPSRIMHACPAVLCYPVFYLLLETAGIRLTTASESGIIISSCPIICLIASTLILKRRPTPFQIAGILFTLFGTAISVLSKSRDVNFSSLGYLALFLALIIYSFYSVSVERLSSFYSGTDLTFLMLAAGFLFFGCGAIAEHLHTGTISDLLNLPFKDSIFRNSILYLSFFSSLLAFFLNNLAISRIGTNRTATFAGIDTAVSILLGVLIQHDSVSFFQILGGFLILSGVYLANSFSHPHRESDSDISSC